MRVSSIGLSSALAVLALYDLRVDIQLLLDHFTWSALIAAITAHPLAIAVLLLVPLLLRRRKP